MRVFMLASTFFIAFSSFAATYRVEQSYPEGRPVAGKPALLQFSLFQGRSTTPLPRAQLRLEHERPIHLFMLDSGFQEYVHEHPEEVSPGVWQLRFTVRAAGQYRTWMQFLPEGEARTKTVRFDELIVEHEGQVVPSAPLDTSERLVITDGAYTFRVQYPSGRPVQHGNSELKFVVEKDGVVIPTAQLQDYLGAKFHVVGSSADKRDFVHAHPGHDHGEGHFTAATVVAANEEDKDSLTKVHFMQEGFYGLFVQFQHEGVVHTGKFGVIVEKVNEN